MKEYLIAILVYFLLLVTLAMIENIFNLGMDPKDAAISSIALVAFSRTLQV